MNKIDKHKNNKIPKAFFVAIGFSVLFWSLITLSKDYTTIVSFPVTYINLPQDKMIQSTPRSSIDIQIKSTGFRLLKQSIFNNELLLNTKDLQKKTKSEFYFLLQNQKPSIQNQLTNNLLIDYIIQDTVFLNLGILTLKKVPVIPDFDISYKSGYHIIDKIELKPDSIIITGPEAQVANMDALRLEKLSLTEVSDDIIGKIKILPIIGANQITFSTKDVTIEGKVDRFTEGFLELPFEIINMPENILVNTFPKTIKVVYQVGLSNFNKVDKNSFKVVCDYQHSSSNNLKYLVPKVIKKPSYVSAVSVSPNKIEFLIQK